MNTNLIIFELILICAVAILCELYKKCIRKGSFKDWEVWILAFILSAICSFVLYKIDDFGIGWYIMLAQVIIVYAFQLIVDLNLVKKIFNAILQKSSESISGQK